MPSILELQDLYNEALVRQIIEKTKACGLVWNSLGGTQFQATDIDSSVVPNITWDFFITETQIGNLSYTYTLNIKKNAVSYITVQSGVLAATGRDSAVQELYQIVELIVLEMDVKLKETLQFVQNITDCRS